MSNFDSPPEFQDDAPLWVRVVMFAFANALATFLLCSLVLTLEVPAAPVLLVLGLAAVPFIMTALARATSSASTAHLSPAANAGYFLLFVAFGVAVEIGTVLGLIEIFWSGPQWGA